MKCPYCKNSIFLSEDFDRYGDLERDSKGNVYNILNFKCERCGRVFHTKTKVANIPDDIMKTSINNQDFLKTVEYELGSHYTGFYKSSTEVPYNMSVENIEKAIRDKEGINYDVAFYDDVSYISV